MTLPHLLTRIGWPQTELADRLGVNRRTVRRWTAGQNETPAAVLAWLARVADAVDAMPPPGKW